MTKEWNIAVLLRNEPISASYDIGKDGAPLEKRLVKDLLSAEVKAIEKSCSLPGAHVTTLAWGSEEPTELLKKSLALGADEAVWIGQADWPRDADVRVVAESLKPIAAEYDLLLLADTGSSTAGSALAAAVALALGAPSFEGVLDYTARESGILLKRKLEEGRRQEIFASLPLVLGLLPDSATTSYYTLAGKLTAAEKTIYSYPVSYRVLARKANISLARTAYWQKKPLRPQTKQIWQPDPTLSGGMRKRTLGGDGYRRDRAQIRKTNRRHLRRVRRTIAAVSFGGKRS